MITTFTAKRRNVGDYLISYRSHNLLKRYIDPDLVDLNRFRLQDDYYDIINSSRALFLCGGPAYRDVIYPKIYPLDLDRVKVPVIPYGLGWKAPASVTPENFSFTPESQAFIKRIHSSIPQSSVRDTLTEKVLNLAGADNVVMTGCPVTYELGSLDKEFPFKENIETLILSSPAIVDEHVLAMTKYLAQRFPKARKILAMHHGYYPQFTKAGIRAGAGLVKLGLTAKMQGYEVIDMAADLDKLFHYYDQADLHIGYRVHGHLYCISNRIPTMLICEDVRGAGQAETLGFPVILSNEHTTGIIKQQLNHYFESKGSDLNAALPTIQGMWGTMESFLNNIKDFLETAEGQQRKSA